MAVRYRRLPQGEPDEEEVNKKHRANQIEKITAKIHAALWVIVAGLLVYFTDFISLIFSDKVNRLALNISLLCTTVVVTIFLYLSIWLPIIMKNNAPWNVYCPNMIPAAAGFSVVSFISFIVSFWPVWGFLSPFLVTFLTMGLLFSAHFVPWPSS